MYLTEEEARKKWCPQARMEGDEGGTWNRTISLLKRIFGWTGGNPYPEETCNCIASECMMWAWEYKNAGPLPMMTNQDMPERVLTGKGCCGLAKQRGIL